MIQFFFSVISTCPQCKIAIPTNGYEASTELRDKIAKEEVRCLNHTRGCLWLGPHSDLDKHTLEG